MLRLLQIEFHKLRYSRATKIMLIVYFLLFFSMTLFSTIHFNFGGLDFKLADQGIFNFPYIWHFNTYYVAILKIFLAIIVISLITNEYRYDTIKQNLIDGLSKKEFVLSKLYMIFTLSFLSTLLVFLVSLGLGYAYSETTKLTTVFSEMEYLGAYFIKLIGFLSLCFFLGTLVKKSTMAIGLLLIYAIFEGIVKTIIKGVAFTSNPETDTFHFVHLFPLEAMSNLIKQPFSKLKSVQGSIDQFEMGVQFQTAVEWNTALIVLGWSFIFIYSSYVLLHKKDL